MSRLGEKHICTWSLWRECWWLVCGPLSLPLTWVACRGYLGDSLCGDYTAMQQCRHTIRGISLFSNNSSSWRRLLEIVPSQLPLFVFPFSTFPLFFVTVLSHVPNHFFVVFPFILPFQLPFYPLSWFWVILPCGMPSIPLIYILPPRYMYISMLCTCIWNCCLAKLVHF